VADPQIAEAERGRDAYRPGEIPGAGWRDVILRVKRRIADDHLSIVAAGAAFYALLATFPALSTLFGIYRLIFDPRQMSAQLSSLQGELPPEALHLLLAMVKGLEESQRWRLMLGVGGGLLVALWGASLGIRALMEALNVAYDEKEKRSFVERIGIALLLTAGAIAVAWIAIAAVIGVPVALHLLALNLLPRNLLVYGRWPVVAAIFWLSLSVMYRYGPSRERARWPWVSWGALTATVLWLGGSVLISWYVSSFGSFDKAYGSMGFVVILLVWFLLSAYSVLVGAEINAELERQTHKDTTVGVERPVGQRGAKVADTIGKSAT